MLRLWLVNGGDGRTWRASLEDPHTGERQAFAGLPALFAFLEEQTLDPLSHSQAQNQEENP
jgi:hypothetical protein